MHKNLNPNNIIYNKNTGEIRLTGFSKATKLSLEHATAHHLENQSDLHYISPEQTGRMNRSTDHRSDFYSIGIIFYEMLVGELPFQSDDSLEIVHAHIAKKIEPLTTIKANLPVVLSDIILKLTEKIAEDRYQSAVGLLHDLKTCYRSYLKEKNIPSFPLGQKDIYSKFRIPEKLYGRREEINTLMSAYEAVEKGEGKLLFIKGYSGVGKTAIVNEVHKPTVRQKGYFISGKFDQFKFNIPFHAFALAFSELTKYLLSEPEHRLQKIKQELLAALGLNASVLIELVPEFELILGKQMSVQKLNVSETQNRFFFTLFEFVRVFAKKEHPISIFVDDLQWCDDSSLRLIKELILQEIPYLLIIGSYRDNEVDEEHRLALMMDEIQKEKSIEEIHLQPLKEQDVNLMIAETLASTTTETAALTNIIYKQTGGNPFYIYELLKTIHSDGLIYFDYAKSKWNWDLEKITALSVSGHVVELMTRRLKEFDDDCLSLLQLAACLGNTFDLKTLSWITKKPAIEIATQLWPAILEEIIIPTNENYLLVLENEDFGVEYHFQHDRIQQSAYQLIDEEKRKSLHLEIGKVLLEKLDQEERNEMIIDLAQHFNEGRTLIIDQEEKNRLAELNLQAGKKAAEAIAYEAALSYFKIGIDLLPENRWEDYYHTTFDLYTGFAQNAYQTQDFEAAEKAIDLLISKAKSKLEKVKLISIRLRQYTTIGKTEKAVRIGIEGLKMLGYKIPEHPGQVTVLKEVLLAKWNLGRRKPMELLEGKILEDPEKLAAARLMMEVGPSAFVLGNSNLYGLLNLKVVNLSLQHGICPESSFAFISFGAVLGDAFGDYKSQQEFGQLAIAINQKLDYIEYRGRVLAAYGVLTHHFVHHWSEQEPFYKKGIAAGYSSGDLFFLAYCANNVTVYHPSLHLSKIISEQEKYAKITAQTGYQDAIDASNLTLHWIKNMHGLTLGPLAMDGDGFDAQKCLDEMIARKYFSGIGFFQIHQAKIYLNAEKYEEALASVKLAEEHVSSMFSLISLVYLCYISFFTSSGLILSGGHKSSKKLKSRLKKELAKMKKWSKYNPGNFLHWQLLMQAEMAQINNKNTEASQLYEKAIQTANTNSYLEVEAFANEMAAKFYLRTHRSTAAKAHFERAYSLYEKRGQYRKLEFLTETYPDIFPRKVSVRQLLDNSDGSPKTSEKDIFQELDTATLFKSYQAISGEIELSSLLQKMMQITMMNAGAENGMLLLENNEDLYLQAFAVGDEVKTMQNISISNLDNLPKTIVNYVSRTREPIMLDNASGEGQYTEDPYIQENKTKSILCSPIVFLNRLYGVIYLENNISIGAFTPQRLKTLSLLSSQMAISLQNALLYTSLEEKVKERTNALRLEMKKSDELLHNILPIEVADELKTNGAAKARLFRNTTVLISDFVNFTQISEKLTPSELVAELNIYFTAFDKIMEKNGLEKIKTIGDAYLAVCGMPNEDEAHASKAVQAALDIHDFVENRKATKGLFDIRIGLNSGPVVAGIVGVKKFAYDIWGDTVNMASRMESNCPLGKINISEATYQLVKNDFDCVHRGQIEAKNKGMVDMYLVQKP
jgi:predicted ATPase/class 3 adenylate cyclase